MTDLIPVWRANIAERDEANVTTLYASGPDHSTGPEYRAMERGWAHGEFVLTNRGAPWRRLFLDLNHRPSLMWQMAIMTVGAVNGLPAPPRSFSGRTINGLNLSGGELAIRIATDRGLYLPQKMQILIHAQWVDDAAFFGHGTCYNAVFVPNGRPTLDMALGAPAPGARATAGVVLPPKGQFIDYVFRYDWREMHDIAGREDRKFCGHYSEIGTSDRRKQEVFNHRLCNTIVVFHCPDAAKSAGDDAIPPKLQPPANSSNPDSAGIWHIAAMELRVDPELNPNAVALS